MVHILATAAVTALHDSNGNSNVAHNQHRTGECVPPHRLQPMMHALPLLLFLPLHSSNSNSLTSVTQ